MMIGVLICGGVGRYIMVSSVVADALAEMGFNTTVFATDYYVDLKSWKLTRKSSLQRYFKQGQNEGLVVREQVSDTSGIGSLLEGR
jgi:hypothetical protein